MDTAKKTIEEVVKGYRRKYASEYKLLLQALNMRREMIATKVDASAGSDMKPMYELSERLQTAITLSLEPEELWWLKTREGGRWFIKSFPQFSLQ